MSNRTELYSSDSLNDDGAEALNVTATTTGTKRGLDVSVLGGGGSITTATGEPVNWDTITVAEPTTTTETYTYSFDSTDLVIITVTYTDTSKDTISTVVKTEP